MRKKRILFNALNIILIVSSLLLFHKASDKPNIIILKSDSQILPKEDMAHLDKYINKSDAKLYVKDVTRSSLNNIYDNNKLIQEQLYSSSGIVPLQKVSNISFKTQYRIPALVLGPDCNVLFSTPVGQKWETENSSDKIEFSFDTINFANTSESVSAGFWIDKNLTFIELRNSTQHYEGIWWMFEGDSFYPRICNGGNDDIIIVNGTITISRDDTTTLHQPRTHASPSL